MLIKNEKNTKQPLLLEYEKKPEKELEKDIVIKKENQLCGILLINIS